MGVVSRAPRQFRFGLAFGAVATTVLTAWASLAPAQGTFSALQTDVDLIARRARASVVSVVAQRGASRAAAASGEKRHTRVGSGVAVGESSILTTASVVLGADRTWVITANGIQVEAEVAGIDPISNLALLRAKALKLAPLRFATPRDGEVGSWVISLGTSYGGQPTQSVGNVAYRHREPHQTLLQLTTTVYPGNSGAAALTPRGELLGLVQGELGAPELPSLQSDGERRPSGVSFAVPVEVVRRVLQSLERDGRVHHGFMGVTTRSARYEPREEGELPTPLGAEVVSVTPGGPAERAQLQKGDLIVAYEGERVEYPEQLARWVAATPPGTAVDLVFVRNETGQTVRTVVVESPNPMPLWVSREPATERAPTTTARISQIEREIRRLNSELQRMKEPRP